LSTIIAESDALLIEVKPTVAILFTVATALYMQLPSKEVQWEWDVPDLCKEGTIYSSGTCIPDSS